MIQHGAYFRDEIIWRGRTISIASDLRRCVFQVGFWISAMYLASAISKWWEYAPLVVGGVACITMALWFFEEQRGERSVEREISRYYDEKYPPERL